MAENFNRHYFLVIEKVAAEDGGGFWGRVPSLPGCHSQGESLEEAARNTWQAALLWLEEAREAGDEIPPSDSNYPREIPRVRITRGADSSAEGTPGVFTQEMELAL